MRSEADATILAFDFGTRRVGVAVGNTVTRAARPLHTIDAPQAAARFAAIAVLIGEWRPSRLVVGLPLHADGSEHAMTSRARAFARELERRHALAVTLVDERWTSEVARSGLAAAGRGSRADRPLRDQAAAAIILQAFFDDHGD